MRIVFSNRADEKEFSVDFNAKSIAIHEVFQAEFGYVAGYTSTVTADGIVMMFNGCEVVSAPDVVATTSDYIDSPEDSGEGD